MSSDKSPHDPLSLITLDELLQKGFTLITYKPRYSNLHIVHFDGRPIESALTGTDEILVGVFIANGVEVAALADAMTDSGEYCQHLENMIYNTPYFPWGEGHTFQEAVDTALIRINSISRDLWFQAASSEIITFINHYPQLREDYKDCEPLCPADKLAEKWL
jgi:hypothetical protein